MNVSTATTCILLISLFACGDDDDRSTGEVTGETGDNIVADGDGVRGGALYDKYWAVTEDDAPTANHPLWASRPDTTTNTRSGSDTWRCKECHGWDYKGAAGAYASGSHATGIAGVMATTLSPAEIVEELQGNHGYGDVLSEQDLADLAVFLIDYTIDLDDYINADGAFSGDSSGGETAYMDNCSGCHGADGLETNVPGGTPGFEDFPGLIANDNPQEFLHKVRFGQPGTLMPALADQLADRLSDLGAFSQTLPTGAE